MYKTKRLNILIKFNCANLVFGNAIQDHQFYKLLYIIFVT